MRTIGVDLRGRWHRRCVLTLAVLGLLVGLGSSTAAAGTTKRVACQLPFVSGAPNFFCSDLHQILFFTDGYDPNVDTIKSELLAMDEQGNVLKSIPVHAGDYVRMTSNTNSSALKVSQLNNVFTVVAPIPVLHVIADDGVTKSEAFCSNVPFLQVTQPNNAVVSLSQGDVTHVEAAMPLVAPSKLVIDVDGADVFALLGIGNPGACTAASPCGGSTTINGNPVTVSDLVVDSGRIDVYAANTVSFDITGLGCGGHLFSLKGAPRVGAVANFVSSSCHKGTSDTALSSGFGINITQPTSLQAGLSFPVEVKGEVCSGRPIEAFNINGQDYPTSSQTLTSGNGTTSADTYQLDFGPGKPLDVEVSQTDVAEDIQNGDAPLGTFDPGSNRLIASATDDLGNRAFSTLFFGTDTTLNPGGTPAVMPALGNAALGSLINKIQQAVQQAGPATVPVDNAFVVGLSPAAVQQQFAQRCPAAGQQFATSATQKIQAVQIPSHDVNPPCACDTTATFTIGTITIDPTQISCNVTFPGGGLFHVEVDLPDVSVAVSASGHCGDCDPFDTETNVSGTTTVSLTGFKVAFDVTQDQLLHTNTTPTTVFVNGTTSTSGNISVDTPCFISQACNFFLDILTLGLVDFTPDINFSNVQDFQQAVGASQPDPIQLHAIKIDPDKVANFNQTVGGNITSVTIDQNGILAGLQGSFATNVADPTIQATTGALITQPPLPSLPVAGAGDAFVALSTDTLNMLFAGMTVGGALKTSCQPSGKTVGDLLPANCETLTNPGGDSATALVRGICHGIRGDACEALTGSTPVLQAIEQGACHGTKGDNCNTIPLSSNLAAKVAEKVTCNATPDLNLQANQSIMFCTRQDIPPRMLPLSGGGVGGSPVNTALRLKATSVALVLDRDNVGSLVEDLSSTPQCFATGAPRIGQCALYEACLDLNFNFDQQFVPPTDVATCGGKPGFKTVFKEIQVLHRQAGVVCSGAGAAGDDTDIVDQTSTNSIVTIQLPTNAQNDSPPICMKGLDLGGFVNCSSPYLLTIETNGDATSKDWLGVTCAITP